MAAAKSLKVVPRLNDYHVSEEIGFMLPEPLVELPEYFEPWNKMNRDLVYLLTNHTLRTAVDQMPLLDDSLLSGHRQLRLAYMFLSVIGGAYIWQEGSENAPRVLPRQLAIPWYSISQRLGLKPAVCQASLVLSNYIHLDRSKPLALGNMKLISKFPGEEPFEWFVLVTTQIELDSVVGIKALVKAMDAVLDNDYEIVCSSLEVVASALRSMKATLTRMYERLPSDFFYNKIRPFLSGYGGNGSKVQEGIIFEGACDTPISVIGGSAAQSSTFQCFDVGLGVDHGDAQNYLNEIRTYMPPAHADFIRALADGPSVKDYVTSCDHKRLKEVYADCISALRDFRSYHVQVVTKYIILPATQKNGDASFEKGTGGTDIIPFLKSVRDTTGSNG